MRRATTARHIVSMKHLERSFMCMRHHEIAVSLEVLCTDDSDKAGVTLRLRGHNTTVIRVNVRRAVF